MRVFLYLVYCIIQLFKSRIFYINSFLIIIVIIFVLRRNKQMGFLNTFVLFGDKVIYFYNTDTNLGILLNMYSNYSIII